LPLISSKSGMWTAQTHFGVEFRKRGYWLVSTNVQFLLNKIRKLKQKWLFL